MTRIQWNAESYCIPLTSTHESCFSTKKKLLQLIPLHCPSSTVGDNTLSTYTPPQPDYLSTHKLHFKYSTKMDLIKSKTLQKGSDFVKVNADEALKDKKFVGFYFSAHWCPPCRGFTPVLKDFYEVIFHFFLKNKL